MTDTKKLQTNVAGYIDWMYQSPRIAERVFLASERGVDKTGRKLFKIFYDTKAIKNGSPDHHTFNGWSHFIAVLQSHAHEGVGVNIDKTKAYIKKQYPDFYANASLSVDYIPLEGEQPKQKVEPQKEETLADIKQLPDVELVQKVCDEETAKEFKKWLKEYLDTFPTFGYSVPSNKGKQRIADEIKGLMEEKQNG